jgi:hypothetical protein
MTALSKRATRIAFLPSLERPGVVRHERPRDSRGVAASASSHQPEAARAQQHRSVFRIHTAQRFTRRKRIRCPRRGPANHNACASLIAQRYRLPRISDCGSDQRTLRRNGACVRSDTRGVHSRHARMAQIGACSTAASHRKCHPLQFQNWIEKAVQSPAARDASTPEEMLHPKAPASKKICLAAPAT